MEPFLPLLEKIEKRKRNGIKVFLFIFFFFFRRRNGNEKEREFFPSAPFLREWKRRGKPESKLDSARGNILQTYVLFAYYIFPLILFFCG